MSEPDGTDVGRIVGGFLNQEQTTKKVRETLLESFANGEIPTRTDLEANLPDRSHRYIRSAIRTLEREGVVKEMNGEYRQGASR